MKRLLPLFLLIVPCVHAQTPGVVQCSGGAYTDLDATHTITKYTIPFSQPTKTGNFIAVFVNEGSVGPTSTVADDQSNTYTQVDTNTSAGNGAVGFMFEAHNITSSTSPAITITFSSASKFDSAVACEFYNVATSTPIDVHSATHVDSPGSGTISSGSITPTVTGDLFFECTLRDSSNGTNNAYIEGSQSNISWHGAFHDQNLGSACQYGIYSSTSAINPSMSQTTAKGYIAITLAAKAASAGSAPGAFNIDFVHHMNSHDETAASRNIQIPCTGSGKLIVIAESNGTGSPARSITAITDSSSNSYSHPAGAPLVDAGNNTVDLWYAKNATCSDTLNATLTITGSNATGYGETYMTYVISGADTSNPIDTGIAAGSGTTCNASGFCTISGTQTLSGNITGAAVTPSTSSGMVLSWISIAKNSITLANTSTSPSGGAFDATVGTCATGWTVPIVADENNGWESFFPTSTATVTFTWGQDNCQQTGVGAWASASAAFKAATTPTSKGCFISLLGVGQC